jgi:beta-mannosidase
MNPIPLHWQLGHHAHPDAIPLEWMPAEIPGAVQLDCARALDLPDYWKASNFLQFRWMEDTHWTYQTKLDVPDLPPGTRLYFVCGGVDYQFEVKLNGTVLHAQEGMFTPVEIDLTGRAKTGDFLSITIAPAPKLPGRPVGRWEADRSCKPPVGYGWDWHPRLVPLGIWRPAGLEIRPDFHIRAIDFHTRFDPDMVEAVLELSAQLSTPGRGQIEITLTDPDGTTVFTHALGFEESAFEDGRLRWSKSIPFPRLWWPNGHGPQSLYTVRVRLLGQRGEEMDTVQRRLGFRRIRLVMHEGAWDLPATGGMPASRRHPPITLEVNNRPIFAKGTNWVPPEIFPGTLTRATYLPLLRMARNAHFNLLRCWGGGIVNPPEFYDLCDELGLLVWTEFPLSCLPYEADWGSPYLRVLDQESQSIIRQVRGRACHALWCGGNELFNSWSRMTDQSPALRLLHRNCTDLDPETPFLPTSPLMGMAHGDYRFRDPEGREVFQIYAAEAGKKTAFTEFGVPGPPSADSLRAFIPADELFPPRPGTAWESHHALGAWDVDPESWLMRPTLEHYFGPAASLEELVEHGEILQSQGYKCVYEEARRQKPICAMALNWCYNEPWPCAANNSLIHWPDKPKPAYFAVAASCRPTIASARIPKFTWDPGETFGVQLWILNDAWDSVPSGRFEAELDYGGRTTTLGNWDFNAIDPNKNLQGPTAEVRLPADLPARFKLRVRVIDHPAWDSEYLLLRARRVPSA